MSPVHGGELGQLSMLELFRMEAEAQARTLTEGLLRLEQGAPGQELLASLMRAAHSIKGAAAIVGRDLAVQIAHALEDAFVAAQQGRVALGAGAIDVLLAGVDLLRQCAQHDEAGLAAWLGAQGAALADALQGLHQLARGDLPAAAPARPAPSATPAPTPAAATRAAPDRLLALAGQARIQAHQFTPLLQDLQRLKRQQRTLDQALDQLLASAGERADSALLAQVSLAMQAALAVRQGLPAALAEAEQLERRQQRLAGQWMDEVLRLRMRRFGDGVHALPRMVRDLGRQLGKNVRLSISGEATPVDRDMLRAIDSVLSQLLRNAVDHGMETPEQRRAAGKPELGEIRLSASHRGGMLVIELADDGCGVDQARVRERVLERKLATAAMAAQMSDSELLDFLFLPAFSLRDTATAVSGRGVGLDLVQQAVRALQGSIALHTAPGQGLLVRLTLPLTQSLLRALVVRIAGDLYALPLAKVERVLELGPEAIRTLEGKQYIAHGTAAVALVPAAPLLGLGAAAAGERVTALLLGQGERQVALVVDAVVGERNLVVQPLEPAFGKLRDVAAGALLEDGASLLILDVADLLASLARLLDAGSLAPLAGPPPEGGARRILVVDDSLTVRETERQLLQARGYLVDTAVDGIDGWNRLREGQFDLLITDIDMPRMDGIALVTQVRADARLARLPVMVVSYKDRGDDRARGLAAGADYYLTKGSFHDTSLLDAVQDLIGEARI
ncbi:hybrid sensor histidine kinase/response regulator [Massilia sp. TS11]|uniref:hybrid sensor histidine kinase/response regulator n=1 Tax=Massilia sp. TS11 TaxID=2908003 RepID=UPI001EDA22D5|nr:response regulator [Massilia sp. TS11]MCG2586188.1 response regulator [Massilia sp. TS11]